MSGFQTHALVGAVGGFALSTALEQLRPALLAQAAQSVGTVSGCIVLVSAIVALWPDVDEPGSWIARRVQAFATLLGVGLGLALPVVGGLPPWMIAAGALIGIGVGWMAGTLLLRSIRLGAGGHRRLTHSLVLSLPLAGLAAYGVTAGWGAWALLPAALAWGQWLHLLADIVTPGGVPILFPFSDRDLRILPEPLCRFGEPLIALSALGLAWVLIRG
jgi:membrane-bound metal-dependent hydrolase YbcI (DUF457 family)